jgi:3-phenylpropionate/cinnamic acid dioxygenase small subunit
MTTYDQAALMAFADRQAVVDLQVAYTWTLDTKDFQNLRNVFLPDATFNTMGTPHVGIEAIISRVSGALTPLDDSQHVVSNHQVTISGDTAKARCYLVAQHVRNAAKAGPNYIMAGRYEDDLVRTPDGWRIKYRNLVITWTDGNRGVVRPSTEQ